MESSASFGYWMRRQRKALDLTQQALADQVGYSLATLKKIEADERRPSRELAERLADYLAIPADQRQRFIECARGLQPVDNMPLANKPASLSRSHSNLPKPLTSFIGREKEIQQVERLVSKARLVTITGPGGVGKTRLAIQVAGTLAPQFRDGVWWVGLASLFETKSSKKQNFLDQQNATISEVGDDGLLLRADLVAQAVTKVLRILESPGVPLLEGVLEHLFDKQLLLVMDNCEHLIEACAALAEGLLINCPQVTILATSREALGVASEKAWSLPSLSLPEMTSASNTSHIYQSEAVSLFIERAADVLPGYKPDQGEVRTIGQICLRLDGIPLAIELAAARTNLLSAQEISGRLDQRFSLLTSGLRTALPRHQTLRAAIEWSYELLNENEQVLLRCLSVFAGSFTLEAAEAICASQEFPKEEVLSLLGRLVDKSLLNVEPAPPDSDMSTRYRLLDTIRSYGRLKLDKANETWLIQKHYEDFYVSWVEAVGRERSLDTLRGFRRLEVDGTDVKTLIRDRQADLSSIPAEIAEAGSILNGQMRWIKLLQAENENLRAVVEGSAASDQAKSALRLVGNLLWFWYYFGSIREGRDLALTALASPSSFQFREERARALNTAGFLHCMLGDITSARQSLEEALSILRTSDDEASLAWSLQFLGMAYTFQKEYDLADKALKEGLTIARKLGDVHINSFAFFQGDIDLQRGDSSQAIKTYEESANFQRAYGNKSFLAYPLRRLGYLALEQHDIQNAKNYFKESLTLNHEVSDMPGVTASLTSFAALANHLEKPDVAAHLYGLVERRLESLSLNLLYLDQAELARIHNHLITCLDKMTFEAAFSEGWEMSEEQAIDVVEELLGGVDEPLIG